jgi:hypothetical protein
MTSRVTGPLFKWFGSKWLSSRTLPAPAFDKIVEPFAGGAGYSLRHHERAVVLYEADPHVSALWKWLIEEATPAAILDIPVLVPEGTDIRTLGLTPGQRLLLKNWQRTNNVGDCWTVSPWGNKPGQWTANTRARVSEQSQAVKHWKMRSGSGMTAFTREKGMATWFIDPPYEFNYQYRSKQRIDYEALGKLASGALGQPIVCEAVCQQTGQTPSWLPFTAFGSRVTSRRKKGDNHHSRELIWSYPPATLRGER